MTPKIESVKKNRYNYTQFNKKYGKDIAGSFIDRNGNPAHTYDPESSISDILGDQKTEDLWQATISTLTTGKRPPHKVGIKEAIDESKTAIIQFLEANKAVLKTKNEQGQWKEQTQRRIDDLDIYCACANQNFDDLVQGIQEYHKRELATQQATAASSNAGNPARAKD